MVIVNTHYFSSQTPSAHAKQTFRLCSVLTLSSEVQ